MHDPERVRAGARLRIGVLRTSAVGDARAMKLLAATLALAISVSGCSFVTTSAPKAPPDPPSCNDSYGAPLGDVLGVFVGAPVLALFVWIATDDSLNNDQEDVAIGATMGTAMIAFAASAIVGFSRVSRCEDAVGAYQGQLMMRPQPYYASPPGYAPPLYVPPPEPPVGAERGLCRADQTCDAGLTCASNRCVVLPTR